jgi:hypothetical protein
MRNIPTEVVAYQKRVFAHFGYNVVQVLTDLSHAEAIDQYLLATKWRTISIFDIDCVPIRKGVIEEAHFLCQSGNVLYGSAQQAAHIAEKYVYVSPAFCNFSYRLYDSLGKPSFQRTVRADVGGEITKLCEQSKKETRIIFPTSVEVPLWSLGDGGSFGLGTVYGERVYHAFRIRKQEQTVRFVAKCRAILG